MGNDRMEPYPGRKSNTVEAKPRHILKFVLLGVIIALLFLAGRLFCKEKCKEPLEANNMTGKLALLVDATDEIPSKYLHSLESYLEELLRELPNPTYVRIYTIDSDPDSCKCAPGPWRKWVSWICGDKRDLDKFVADVIDSTKAKLRGEPADSTPLLERLSKVSRAEFSNSENSKRRNELWIISDMLQLSDKCSFYGDSECIDPEWVLDHEDFEVEWESKLSGVKVKIFRIPRGGGPPNGIPKPEELMHFWETFVRDARNGAESVEWFDL